MSDFVTNYGEGAAAKKRDGGQVNLYPYRVCVWGGGGGRTSSDHAEEGGGAQQVLE